MELNVGDIVSRKSYNHDVLFRIEEFDESKKTAVLKGIDIRLVADAPLDDLAKVDEDEQNKRHRTQDEQAEQSVKLIFQERKLLQEKNDWFTSGRYRSVEQYFEMPGKVLHVDGDLNYLKKCLTLYRDLNIPVTGVHIAEKDMAAKIPDLLEKYNPDILVITGHDGFVHSDKDVTKISSYRNSGNFIEAIKAARKYERNRDVLIIFAGACQSHFEALLEAGANFASSPGRILIHALDPVFIAEKVAYTSIRETINLFDLMKNTITGMDGLGGIETKGSYRVGFPKTSHSMYPFTSMAY